LNKSVFDLLHVLAIEDGQLVNDAYQRFTVWEAEGLPCHYRSDSDLKRAEQFFSVEALPNTIIEYHQLSKLSDPSLDERLKTERNSIIRQRLEFLTHYGVKYRRHFFSITNDKPRSSPNETPLDLAYHKTAIDSISPARKLDEDEIRRLLYEIASLDSNLRLAPDMSTREQVIQSQIEFDSNYLKIGPNFAKVLTLKNMPDETEPFALALVLDLLCYQYLFQASFAIIDQTKEKSILNRRKLLAFSWSQRNKNAPDEASGAKYKEASELVELLAVGGAKIGLMDSHITVWDKTLTGVAAQAEKVISVFKDSGYFYNEESFYHDVEYFRSMPGCSPFSKRKHKVISPNFLESLPISSLAKSDLDSEYPMILFNRFDGLFGFDPFSSKRLNKNGIVLGSSGSGKSVIVNELISKSLLPRIVAENGRICVVDYAGADDSSYIKLCDLFGGSYIPIDPKTVSINPFRPRAAVWYGGDDWNTDELNLLSAICDIIISNKADSMEAEIYRGIVRNAIMSYYKTYEAPKFSKDFLTHIKDTDKDKEALVKKLFTIFLDSPESRLLTSDNPLKYDGMFVVFDLHGAGKLSQRMKEIVSLLVVNECRTAALGVKGASAIIWDELAQHLTDPRVVFAIQNFYSTFRKSRAQVLTITQFAKAFNDSAISGTVKMNSSYTMFLFHEDSESRRYVSDAFGLQDLEQQAFFSLRTEPRQFSEILFKSSALATGHEVARLVLSPLDYWISTSDKKDRLKLEAIAKERGCTLVEACYIAAQEGV